MRHTTHSLSDLFVELLKGSGLLNDMTGELREGTTEEEARSYIKQLHLYEIHVAKQLNPEHALYIHPEEGDWSPGENQDYTGANQQGTQDLFVDEEMFPGYVTVCWHNEERWFHAVIGKKAGTVFMFHTGSL